MKNRKQMIVTVSLIIILIIAVIGVSYAAFTYVGRGEKINQITTGTISMEYTESDNVISINNALPTTDETGKVRLRDGEYFDFSVSTNLNGNAVINYEIAAEDFEDNTFDGANVKFYLTKLVGSEEIEVSNTLPAVYKEEKTENKKTGRPSNMMSLLSGSTSTQGEETTNYRLRLYVDEAYNPQGDGGSLVFKTRINVYGKVAIDNYEIVKEDIPGGKINIETSADYNTTVSFTPLPDEDYMYDGLIIASEEGEELLTLTKDETSFQMPKENIKITPKWTKRKYTISKVDGTGGTITILGSAEAGEKITLTTTATAGYVYDGATISSDENEAMTLNPSQKSFTMPKYNIRITPKWILLPMIKAYSYTISTEFHNSTYENKITKIVIKNNTTIPTNVVVKWDVSAAKNNSVIAYLENDGSGGYKLTIGGNGGVAANTRSEYLFGGMENVTSIDLQYLDTSKVTNMQQMFFRCLKLSSLNLSKFNTSKVTNMNQLFQSCKKLTSLNLTTFDTSKVTDMKEMFYNCIGLKKILVGPKWTTAKADTTNMYYYCTARPTKS